MCVEMKDIQRKDFIKGVSAAIVEQIPVANFFLSAIDNVKGNVLQRKFEEWQEMVGNRLSTLEKEVFDNLGNNETFATTLLKTTELASHSNKKKMELLANAVKYVTENEIDDDYLIFFLNCMAKYTYSHLAVLCYFQTPYLYSDDLDEVIEASPLAFFTHRCVENYSEIMGVAIDDLIHDKLLDSETLERKMDTKEGILAKQTTQLCDLFIDFFGIKDIDL